MRRLDLESDDGMAMAEFALIVPVFLLIFVGMVAMGRAFFLWNDVNHEANETARWAAIDHNPYAPPPSRRRPRTQLAVPTFASATKMTPPRTATRTTANRCRQLHQGQGVKGP